MLVTVAMSTCVLASCGDEEKDKEPEVPSDKEQVSVNPIVGVWKCIDANGDTGVLTLNADHTGKMEVSVTSRVTVVAYATQYFNWNTSDDSNGDHWFEIIHTGGDVWFEKEYYIYILAGDKLKLDQLIYTRIK